MKGEAKGKGEKMLRNSTSGGPHWTKSASPVPIKRNDTHIARNHGSHPSLRPIPPLYLLPLPILPIPAHPVAPHSSTASARHSTLYSSLYPARYEPPLRDRNSVRGSRAARRSHPVDGGTFCARPTHPHQIRSLRSVYRLRIADAGVARLLRVGEQA